MLVDPVDVRTGTQSSRVNAYDAEEAHLVKKSVRNLQEAIKAHKKETGSLFPVDIFHKKIQDTLMTFFNCYGLPIDYHASSILSAVSTAIGNGYVAQYKRGQAYPVINYIAAVGPPSTGKTPGINFGYFPLQDKTERMKKDFKTIFTNWEKQVYQASITKGLSPDPEPARPELIINDLTTEGVNKSMYYNPRGICVYQDELIAWIRQMTGYSTRNDTEYWLKMWNGKPHNTTRSNNSASFYIGKPFVNVVGGVQPSMLHSLSSDGKRGNGFLARILFAYPEIFICPEESDSEPKAAVYDNYTKVIDFIYNLPNKITTPEVVTQSPSVERIPIEMTEKGKKAYISFVNAYKGMINDNIEEEDVLSVLGKLIQYCLRLALTLEILDFACNNFEDDDALAWLNADTIGQEIKIKEDTIDRAIKLIKYFKHTAFKVIRRLDSPVLELPMYKRLFYDNLPEQFKRSTALLIAENIYKAFPKCGLSESTTKRILRDSKLFYQPKNLGHGFYSKLH